MKTAYISARILELLSNIVVAAIVILSIVPIATNQFSIDVPAVSEFDWSFSYGDLTASAPIRILNNGTFDIDDVTITLMVSNSSGGQLLNDVTHWGTIYAGVRTNKNINFSLNLEKMVDDGFGWMLTHSDRLLVKIGVTAKYTMKLVGFSADYSFNLPWEGLVKGAALGAPSLHNHTGSYSMQVPFYVNTTDSLKGYGGNYSLTVTNGTGSIISSASRDILLGANSSGTFLLGLDADAAEDLLMKNQTLTAETTLRLPSGSEFTFIKKIAWAAPMHW